MNYFECIIKPTRATASRLERFQLRAPAMVAYGTTHNVSVQAPFDHGR